MKFFLIHDPKLTSRIPYYEATISKLREIYDNDNSFFMN